jgi:hypothetical protein
VIVTRPIEVKALANFRIWLRYDDNTEGEVDLSDLAGLGVFKAWDDAAFFMYLRLTGKSPDEIFPILRAVHADA